MLLNVMCNISSLFLARPSLSLSLALSLSVCVCVGQKIRSASQARPLELDHPHSGLKVLHNRMLFVLDQTQALIQQPLGQAGLGRAGARQARDG